MAKKRGFADILKEAVAPPPPAPRGPLPFDGQFQAAAKAVQGPAATPVDWRERGMPVGMIREGGKLVPNVPFGPQLPAEEGAPALPADKRRLRGGIAGINRAVIQGVPKVVSGALSPEFIKAVAGEIRGAVVDPVAVTLPFLSPVTRKQAAENMTARAQAQQQAYEEETNPLLRGLYDIPLIAPGLETLPALASAAARAGMQTARMGVAGEVAARAARRSAADALAAARPTAPLALKVAGKPQVAGAAGVDIAKLNMSDFRDIDAAVEKLDDAIKTARAMSADTASLEETKAGILEYRQSLLRDRLSPEGLVRLNDLSNAVREGQAVVEGLGATLKDHPAARWVSKLVSKATGEPVSDALFKKRAVGNYSGYDDLAKSLGYEEGKVATVGVRPSYEMAPDERFKYDLRQLYLVSKDVAVRRGRLRAAENELANLNVGIEKLTVPQAVQGPAAEGMAPRTAVQAGMGIGEKPPQAEMLAEFRGEGGKPGVQATEEQVRAREAARPLPGQAELVPLQAGEGIVAGKAAKVVAPPSTKRAPAPPQPATQPGEALGSIVPLSPEAKAHTTFVDEAMAAAPTPPKARKPRAKKATAGAAPPAGGPPVAEAAPPPPSRFPPGFKQPTEDLLKFSKDNGFAEDAIRYAQGEAASAVPELRGLQKLVQPLRALADPIKHQAPAPGVQSAYLVMDRLLAAERQWSHITMLGIVRMMREAGASKQGVLGARVPELERMFAGDAAKAEQPYIGTIAHMLENSGRYSLTPKWKRVVREWKDIFDKDLHRTQGMGVKAGEVEGVYVPHIYRDQAAAERAMARVGGRGKPGVLKERKLLDVESYEFAEANNLQRETDIAALGFRRFLALSKLRSEIVFGDGLAAQFGGKRLAGAKRAPRGRAVFTRGGISWDLPEEIAGQAERVLAPLNEDNLSGFANAAVQNFKAGLLTLDFSVGGMIQGLLGFMADPLGAVGAYAAAWKSLLTPDGEALYLAQKAAGVIDWNLHGLNLGVSPLDLPVRQLGERPTLVQRLPGVKQLEDVQFGNIMPKLKHAIADRNLSYLLALQQDRNAGGLMHKVPVIGPVMKRLGGKLYSMSLDELKDVAADAASNWLGGVERARYSSQRLGAFRNIMVLTESWTRAQVGIITNAPKLSPKGILARRMLMQEVAIGLGIAEAVNLITGHDTILDPRSQKWGSVWTPLGYVKVIPHATLLRTAARLGGGIPEGEFGAEKGAADQRWSALSSWSEARGGQVPHLIVDLVSGKDFFGRPIDSKALHLAQQLAPIPAQNAMERFGRPESLGVKLGQAAIGLTGANVSFVPVREQLSEIAREMGIAGEGEKFEELPRPQQVEVEMSPEGRVVRAAGGETVPQQQRLIRIKFRDEQLARDSDMLEGKLLPEDWVDEWRNARIEESGRIAEFQAEHPREFGKPKTLSEEAAQGYYDLMEVFRDPRTGIFDKEGWAEAERVYMEALPVPVRADVEMELHPYDTPLAKRFRQDREQLDPYFSIRGEYLKTHQLAAALQEEVRRAVLDRDAHRIDVLKRHPALKQMEKEVARQKEMMRKQYPDLDAILRFWGYVATSKTRAAEAQWQRMLDELQPAQQTPVERR